MENLGGRQDACFISSSAVNKDSYFLGNIFDVGAQPKAIFRQDDLIILLFRMTSKPVKNGVPV
jgi:hypothetical protein